MNGVNEGVRLIRGTSVNQPEKNDHVLVTAGVGVPTSAMILGKLREAEAWAGRSVVLRRCPRRVCAER